MKTSTVKYTLKLFRDDKMVSNLHTKKKMRLPSRYKVLKWENAYLKVEYGKDLYNDGTYSNIKDLHRSFLSFIEPELIRSFL